MTSDYALHLKDAVANLVRNFAPEKIILFGSAARGTLGPDSDLDFLIIKKDLSSNSLERMRQARRAAAVKAPCDFLVLTPEEYAQRIQWEDPFYTSIMETGKILYD